MGVSALAGGAVFALLLVVGLGWYLMRPGAESGAPPEDPVPAAGAVPEPEQAEPEATPAPEAPATAPASKAPAPVASGPRGTVRVEGDALKVELTRAGRSYSPTQKLRPGSYDVRAVFEEDGGWTVTGKVDVVADEEAKIICVRSFRRCRVQ